MLKAKHRFYLKDCMLVTVVTGSPFKDFLEICARAFHTCSQHELASKLGRSARVTFAMKALLACWFARASSGLWAPEPAALQAASAYRLVCVCLMRRVEVNFGTFARANLEEPSLLRQQI